MSWQAIAKKDFQDSVRSRTLWAVIVLFFLGIGGLTYLVSGDLGGEETLVAAIGGTLVFGILLFIPLTGLFISVKSVVRERESGTINLLLSMPHSRGEMVVGKFLGRSAVMTLAVLVGFIPAVVLIFVQGDVSIVSSLVFLLAPMLFGLMFVGIGVGFSALFNTETQATIGGIVIFFALYLWRFVLGQIFGLIDASVPAFLERFYLLDMFGDMVDVLLPDGRGLTAPSSVTGSVESTPDGLETVYPDTVAVYMQNWFVFVILALWIVVPLAIGYYRFSRVDL